MADNQNETENGEVLNEESNSSVMNSEIDVKVTRDEVQKKRFERLEIIIALFLSLTALLTAWASWISSLHSGNQANNYTISNNLSAEANALRSTGTIKIIEDLSLIKEIDSLTIELLVAQDCADAEGMYSKSLSIVRHLSQFNNPQVPEYLSWNIDDYTSHDFQSYEEVAQYLIDWSYTSTDKREQYKGLENYIDFEETYYKEANDKAKEAEEHLEQGNADNHYGDSYNLVTVIYSIVLFLLGIVGIFKSSRNRYILVCIALVAFLIATIYMITIPLPTGFTIFGFIG